MNDSVVLSGLDNFLNQAGSTRGLTREKEYELAVEYAKTGSQEAAHELVVSHLPFVIKIAFQHRGYMIPLQDLIQEGAIGLMKAVKRFDPYKGYRLASFAFWWIRAYIRNFILNCWNLVKLGTTQAQRKLFFRIGDIGEHFDQETKSNRVRALAAKLRVKEDDVIEMEARVKAPRMVPQRPDRRRLRRQRYGSLGRPLAQSGVSAHRRGEQDRPLRNDQERVEKTGPEGTVHRQEKVHGGTGLDAPEAE